MNDDAPEVAEQPSIAAAPTLQTPSARNEAAQPGAPTVPASGARRAFRDIRRQLTEEELTQSGVQKLVLEDFERAETECEALRVYVERFHDADKRVGIMAEKLKVDRALEITTGVGLVGGGAVLSLAPSFWAVNTFEGIAALIVGALFIVGAIVAKVVQRAK